MPQLLLTEGHLAELFVESILYGMHIVSAGCCLHALTSTGRRRKSMDTINWAMLIVCAILLVNGTFNIAIEFHEAVKVFIFASGLEEQSALYSNISEWENVAKPISIYLQTLIGDAVLLYRCWIIYYRSWKVIALPFLLWFAMLGSAIWTVFLESTLHTGTLNQTEIWPARATFWSVTTAINIITTSLLVWRIWRVDQDNRRSQILSNIMDSGSQTHLRDVIGIVVESGLMYSAAALITGVTNAARNNSMFIVSAAEIQIVGIAFNLILIRLGRLSGQGTIVRKPRKSLQAFKAAQVASPSEKDDADSAHVRVSSDGS